MNTAEELPPPYAPPEVLPFELISLASTVGSDLVPLPALKPFLVAFASLVSEIAAFDGVEQQLATQSDLVSQMEANLAQDKKQLDLLHKSIEKELKDIHKLEHFSFKQLGAKIKGKTHYESQLNGATAKLLEDRQKADKLASEIASLTEVLTSAVTERDFLASRQSELQNWRQQLDSFLDKTFYSIHDPSVLVLDREARLKQHIFNLEAANAESAVLRSEFLAAQKEIESAKQLLNSSVNNLDSALQSANTDIYFSNGYSEWNEYASSQQAQQDAARAGKHVQRAKAILPGLPPSLGLFEFEGVSA
ncbi:hypothetical protein BC830DRAFT_1099726 [Chytriomyces sp. MP71]|nr:hypothetical protein BC830DRAFT_1099726 [Chytriomyces sp. MP71]